MQLSLVRDKVVPPTSLVVKASVMVQLTDRPVRRVRGLYCHLIFQVFAIYLGSLSRGLNRGLTINWTGPQVKSGRFKGLSFYYLLEAFEHRIFFFGHLVTRLLQNRLKVKFNCKIIKNFIEGKNESPRPRI